MDAADMFLDACVEDGSLSQAERDEVRLGRQSSGCVNPPWKPWEHSNLHPKLSKLDCEIYSNHPAWSLTDIASHLNITVGAVRAALARVRRVLPSLQNDPDGRFGLPSLEHMVSLNDPSVPEPNPDRIIKF